MNLLITLVTTHDSARLEPHPLPCLVWSMSQNATIPPPRRPKSFNSYAARGHAGQNEVELRRTCHRVRLDRLETTIGYLRRALHGASLGQGVKVPSISWERVGGYTFHGPEGSAVVEIWQCQHCRGYLHGQSWRLAWDEHTPR